MILHLIVATPHRMYVQMPTTSNRRIGKEAESSFVTHAEFSEFRGEMNEAFRDLRGELKSWSRDLSSQLSGVGRTNWGTVISACGVVVVVAGMAAALVNSMMHNEQQTRIEITKRIDQQLQHEREMSRYSDELRLDLQKEVVSRLETTIAQEDVKSELRDKNQQNQIDDIRNKMDQFDDMIQREMRLLDTVLQREMNLNVERLDALIKTNENDINSMKSDRFTDSEGKVLRDDVKLLQQKALEQLP